MHCEDDAVRNAPPSHAFFKRGAILCLVAAGWMAALGLISVFVLTMGTLWSAFFFAIATLSAILAVVQVLLARLALNPTQPRS
jgi:hypothetical protein